MSGTACTRSYAVVMAALAAVVCQAIGVLAQTVPEAAPEAGLLPPPPPPPRAQSGITENVGSVLLMYHQPEDELPTWAIVLMCLGALAAQTVFLITIIVLRKKKKRINAIIEARAAAAAAEADAEAGALDGAARASLGGKGAGEGRMDSYSFDAGAAGKGEVDSAAYNSNYPTEPPTAAAAAAAAAAGQAAGGTHATQPAFQDDSCRGKPTVPGS